MVNSDTRVCERRISVTLNQDEVHAILINSVVGSHGVIDGPHVSGKVTVHPNGAALVTVLVDESGFPRPLQ